MLIRPYTDADLNQVLELYRRQGLEYDLPILNECPIGAVIEEGGDITHAAFMRQTSETYWLFDPEREWKRQRLGRLLILHKELNLAAAKMGMEDTHIWVPPEVLSAQFEYTLFTLGWVKPLWTCFSHKVEARVEAIHG